MLCFTNYFIISYVRKTRLFLSSFYLSKVPILSGSLSRAKWQKPWTRMPPRSWQEQLFVTTSWPVVWRREGKDRRFSTCIQRPLTEPDIVHIIKHYASIQSCHYTSMYTMYYTFAYTEIIFSIWKVICSIIRNWNDPLDTNILQNTSNYLGLIFHIWFKVQAFVKLYMGQAGQNQCCPSSTYEASGCAV